MNLSILTRLFHSPDSVGISDDMQPRQFQPPIHSRMLFTVVSLIKDSHLTLIQVLLYRSSLLDGMRGQRRQKTTLLHTSPYPWPRLGSGSLLCRGVHRVSHDYLNAGTENVNPV